MKKLRGCFKKGIKGYARKAVVYLLITAILAPCFYVQKARALPAGLTVTKSVQLDTSIASNGGAGYTNIPEGYSNVADTNVLKYSYVINNSNAVPLTVTIKTEMPTNTILFFDKEYNESNDGRTVTGTQTTAEYANTYPYTDVCYGWFNWGNLYSRSIAASVTKPPEAGPFALRGPFSLSLNGVMVAMYLNTPLSSGRPA